MDKKIITISRQCGSGGHTIGKMVAEKLNIPFYDKQLLKIVAERSGLAEEVIEEKEQARLELSKTVKKKKGAKPCRKKTG